MHNLYSFALIAAMVTSTSTTTYAQVLSTPAPNIETKTAIVVTDTTEGNYFEFLDGSGGWWLEADGEHPTFEVGQVMRFTIDNQGTNNLEDDELLIMDSLGGVIKKVASNRNDCNSGCRCIGC